MTRVWEASRLSYDELAKLLDDLTLVIPGIQGGDPGSNPSAHADFINRHSPATDSHKAVPPLESEELRVKPRVKLISGRESLSCPFRPSLSADIFIPPEPIDMKDVETADLENRHGNMLRRQRET